MPARISRHGVEVGILASIGNLLIYQHFMPNIADVKSADQFNIFVESSERTALLLATAWTALVAGFVRSWDTFLVGGAVIVGIDFAFKHANAVHPATGTMSGPSAGGSENIHPMPTYSEAG